MPKSNPLRITIIQGAFLPVPPLMGGAVEKVWYQLGRSFANEGHAVTHISRSYKDLPQRERTGGVSYIRCKGYSASNNSLILKWRDLLYSRRAIKLLPEADILVTNTFFAPVLCAKSNRNGKVYVHVARYPKGQLKFYKKATRLQTVTSAIESAMKEQCPQFSDRMQVVPYPVDLPQSENRASDSPCNTLLYTGRIAEEKGIELLINAFIGFAHSPESKSWKLRLVGPFEERQGGGGLAYLETLKETSAPLKDRIEFVGPIFEKERLNAEYEKARLFCYPSLAERGETFGLAPLEAMAYGTPAIVSDLDCFKDFVDDNRNGRVFDHRAANAPKQLARIFQEFAEKPELISEQSKEAIQTSLNYSYAKVSNLYLEDFRRILAR